MNKIFVFAALDAEDFEEFEDTESGRIAALDYIEADIAAESREDVVIVIGRRMKYLNPTERATLVDVR